jgi:hypothetical protein
MLRELSPIEGMAYQQNPSTMRAEQVETSI